MTEGQAGTVAEGLHSVAQQDDGFDSFPERITPFRVFSGHVHRLVALGFAETAIVVLAAYGAILVRFPTESLATIEYATGPVWVRALLAAGVTLIGLISLGLYQLHHRAQFTGVLARLMIAVTMAEGALWVLSFTFPSLWFGQGVLGLIGVLSLIGLAVTRYTFMRLVDDDVFKRRVLVWGAGERAASITGRLRRRSDQRGFRIMGYIGAPGDAIQVPPAELVQRESDLLRHVMNHRVEEIVVAMDDRRTGFPEAFLRECRLRGVAVTDFVTFLERESGRVSVEYARPSWMIYSKGFRSELAHLATKRLFDIFVSVSVLILAAPIALLAAIAIFLEDRGPILYRQVRVGQNGRPFNMLKFRSMAIDAEPEGKAIWAGRDDPRVTRVGAFIRKVRIDELPQVLNVLVGQMSFVGPRPERPAFVAQLSKSIPFYSERHFVKPGITGWAQVRYPYGASEADAREKLGYDLYYVTNHSLTFDIMVLLQTVEIVLLRIGSR